MGGGDEFFQVGNGVCFLDTVGKEAIELSFWVEEVVVWVYDDDCCVRRHDELRFGYCGVRW